MLAKVDAALSITFAAETSPTKRIGTAVVADQVDTALANTCENRITDTWEARSESLASPVSGAETLVRRDPDARSQCELMVVHVSRRRAAGFPNPDEQDS